MSSSAGKRNNPPLPPEIMEAILPLLPVKSLGRFKSVSKTWCSLISDPQFIKKHLHQNQKMRKLLSTFGTNSLYSVDLSDLTPSLNRDDLSAIGKEVFLPVRCKHICGSCNGLILTSVIDDDNMFLINPATKEIWKVPSPPLIPLDPLTHLRFRDYGSRDYESRDYGFGYDSSTDDYKVVSIEERRWEVSVYSLRNNSWRMVLPNGSYAGTFGRILDGILVNQNLHWLTRRRDGPAGVIVAFSLADEEFIEIETPDSVGDAETMDDMLVDVGGKLGYFVSAVRTLWVMEEYSVGRSWTKVCIGGLPSSYSRVLEVSTPDIIWSDKNGVHVYNMDERKCRNVRIEDPVIMRRLVGCRSDCPHFDSLESPAKLVTRNIKLIVIPPSRSFKDADKAARERGNTIVHLARWLGDGVAREFFTELIPNHPLSVSQPFFLLKYY